MRRRDVHGANRDNISLNRIQTEFTSHSIVLKINPVYFHVDENAWVPHSLLVVIVHALSTLSSFSHEQSFYFVHELPTLGPQFYHLE